MLPLFSFVLKGNAIKCEFPVTKLTRHRSVGSSISKQLGTNLQIKGEPNLQITYNELANKKVAMNLQINRKVPTCKYYLQVGQQIFASWAANICKLVCKYLQVNLQIFASSTL
jgi:hypothetical protein